MKTFHIDEPSEIGKKRLKVSPKDIMGVKKELSDGIIRNNFGINDLGLIFREYRTSNVVSLDEG